MRIPCGTILGVRRVLLSGLVVLSAAAARGVEVEYASDDDPAIKFAANELKRLLGDVPGRILKSCLPSSRTRTIRLPTSARPIQTVRFSSMTNCSGNKVRRDLVSNKTY